MLVGLSEKQIESLPKDKSIRGIKRTENQAKLAELYSQATVFLNPTYEDTFPTTNIESLACGTPVITYRTGGSPEIIDDATGFVTAPGDISAVRDCITKIRDNGEKYFSDNCRKRAETLFDKNEKFKEYIEIYSSIVNSGGNSRVVSLQKFSFASYASEVSHVA